MYFKAIFFYKCGNLHDHSFQDKFISWFIFKVNFPFLFLFFHFFFFCNQLVIFGYRLHISSMIYILPLDKNMILIDWLTAIYRIRLNVMTLHINSSHVYTQMGVQVSVTIIAQVGGHGISTPGHILSNSLSACIFFMVYLMWNFISLFIYFAKFKTFAAQLLLLLRSVS